MKWTTQAAVAANAHWSGFIQSERRQVPCSGLCRSFEKGGKRLVSHFVDSGCEHNPKPRTPRGWRRRKAKGGGE
jgi:hypothetical protein